MNVYAQVDIVDEFNPPFISISELINRLLPNVLLLAGIISFLLLLGGGFMMIHGAREGEADKTAKGKQAATYAIIGFVIIFASYWIIKLVSKVTGIPIL